MVVPALILKLIRCVRKVNFPEGSLKRLWSDLIWESKGYTEPKTEEEVQKIV